MANVRDMIKMTAEEVDAFLHERHTMSVATIGPDGRPHVVAMWYGFLDGKPAFETYRKSQKVKNLERDPRMTCLIEDGDRYDQLSMLRTIEILLGSEPINLGDRMAAPMFGIFADKPDMTPFVVAKVSQKLADADRQRYRELPSR